MIVPKCKDMVLKSDNSMLLFSIYLFRFAYNLCPLEKVPASKHMSPSSRGAFLS